MRLHGGERALRVEVADDGIGFDPTDPELRSRHLGLTSMEERARELGGTLTLVGEPGQRDGRQPGGAASMAPDPIRVLVVDDHAVVREGLRTFLELQDGIEVVGEAADGEQAVARATAARARRDPHGPRDAAPRRDRGDARAAPRSSRPAA